MGVGNAALAIILNYISSPYLQILETNTQNHTLGYTTNRSKQKSPSMEEKRRDAGTLTAAGIDSPASEPASSRRRGGAQKRKAGGAGSSGSSSTPSKRVTREKSSFSHPPIHNGPLTRARQGPSYLASALAAGEAASSGAATKPAEKSRLSVASAGEAMVALAEELNKESELQALEAQIEAEFEAIRSRGASAHVVPSHCGESCCLFLNPISLTRFHKESLADCLVSEEGE